MTLTNAQFQTALTAALDKAVQDQPVTHRRRASITTWAAAVAQLAQIAAVYATDAPWWVALAIGTVIYVAEGIAQATAKNGLGTYQADAIAKAARNAGVVDTSHGAGLHVSTADLARQTEE